jgi:hypothetical protein
VAVAPDGSLFVGFLSDGDFNGMTYAGGGSDGYLVRLSPSGSVLWARAIAGSGYESINDVIVDSAQGAVYVIGSTDGPLAGTTAQGGQDVLVLRYSVGDGTLQWTRRIGGPGTDDTGYQAALDAAGAVYFGVYSDGTFVGSSPIGGYDAYLVKYDPSGNLAWTRQFGSTTYDYPGGVAIDSNGGIYVSGYTDGNFDGHTAQGSNDIFLIKYVTDGTKQWSRLLGGASEEWAYKATVDSSGNAYFLGASDGTLDGQPNAGGYDLVVAKYAPDGTKVWMRQLGGAGYDEGYAIVASPQGGVVAVGTSNQGFDGLAGAGGYDGFAVRLDADGSTLWRVLQATSAYDIAYGIAGDAQGGLYVLVNSGGAFEGMAPTGGTSDVDLYLIKYDSSGDRR